MPDVFKLIVVPHGSLKTTQADNKDRGDRGGGAQKPQGPQKPELEETSRAVADEAILRAVERYKRPSMVVFGPEEACRLTGGQMVRNMCGTSAEKAFCVTIDSIVKLDASPAELASSARTLWLAIRGLYINLDMSSYVMLYCSPGIAAAIQWLSERRTIVSSEIPAEGALKLNDAGLTPYALYSVEKTAIVRLKERDNNH